MSREKLIEVLSTLWVNNSNSKTIKLTSNFRFIEYNLSLLLIVKLHYNRLFKKKITTCIPSIAYNILW
jgi:hypothetical protein